MRNFSIGLVENFLYIMTEQQILAATRQLKSKEDFLKLINNIVIDELGESGSPFTMQQLNYYCRTSFKPHKRYREFYIPKKSGKAPRKISAPCPTLKAILHFVNIILKALYIPSSHAMGFVKGRSVKDNASLHVGKNYVFNTDLKDFFPSISQYRVWKNLQYKPFNFTREIASMIAGLCCIVDKPGKESKGYLPQGSPCSPIITNIVCQKLDYKLSKLARKYNVTYTRYADDITFSSMHNVYQEDSQFLNEFKKIINDEHFMINDSKTRLQKKGERQEVTGLVVNSKINTAREYVRDIQCLLYIWERYGFRIAYSRFLNKYINSKAYLRTTTPDMYNVVEGKLLYLKMVVGETSSVYQKLLSRFTALCPPERRRSAKITFCSSYRFNDFTELFNTTIALTIETTDTSKPQFVAKCNIEGSENRLWINKKVAQELEKYHSQSADFNDFLTRCFVCLAQQNDRTFWLLMKYDPLTKIEKSKSSILLEEDKSMPDAASIDILGKIGEADLDCIEEFVAMLEPEENEEVSDASIIEVNESDSPKEQESLKVSLLSTDEVLEMLSSSNFTDLNILSKWDRTKKN